MALGPTRWTVHPLVYLQRGPAFYLLCAIDDYTDVRQLALHRMLSATALDAKARRPAGFDADRAVARAQGMGGGEPIRLVARFQKRAGLHLLETRLSADQVVEGADAVARRAEALGGKVLRPPQDIPDVGRFCVLQDPQGATLCAMQYARCGDA